MNKTFEAAFARTMKYEGGYSADHADPGGETYMGISRIYWPAWPGWQTIDRLHAVGHPLSNYYKLQFLVRKFYQQQFWDRLHGDKLATISPIIAEKLFDIAVNQAVHVAINYLQQALNLLNINQKIYPDIIEDGLLGRITMQTLTIYFDHRTPSIRIKTSMLLNVIKTLQGAHYIAQMRKYPARERFRGWFTRL